MKTYVLLSALFLLFCNVNGQTTHVVQQVGFTYNPSSVTINVGDKVKFEGAGSHPVLQVSEATWNASGITPLEGGFSFPTGSGTADFNAAGTFYYVCTAHVEANGMKGKIIVSQATGLEENQATELFSIYPVPLQGNELTVLVNLPDQKLVKADIYDVSGKLRMSFSGHINNGRFRMDCSSLPKGIFVLKLKSEEKVLITKLVRE